MVFSPARTVTPGMDCFARLEPDHETTFKRVYFESGPEGEELIRLQPLNSAYPPRVRTIFRRRPPAASRQKYRTKPISDRLA